MNNKTTLENHIKHQIVFQFMKNSPNWTYAFIESNFHVSHKTISKLKNDLDNNKQPKSVKKGRRPKVK